MRLLMLTPALALCLTACGKGDDSEAQNAGRQLTAEAISSNDVTAIDAVTGEAANIAADAELTLEMNNSADGANPLRDGAAARRRPQGSAPASTPAANASEAAPEPAPAADPQSNTQ